jgi:hypothetical protein
MERFDAVLEATGKTATFVRVPLDVRAVFGRARPPVRGSIDGAPFRSTVAVYGGEYFIPVNRKLREASGASAGDTVTVELELDKEPRLVEAPADLRRALDADPEAAAAFERLSYSHRKEWVEWIEEAKRVETRARRLARAVVGIREERTQR